MSSTNQAHDTQSFCALFEAALALAKETGEPVKISYRGQEVRVGPDDDMIDLVERWSETVAHGRLLCPELPQDLADAVMVSARSGERQVVSDEADPELNLASEQQ